MSQSDTKAKLAEAVRELYRVFKPYSTRRHPEGCPCCVSDEDNRRIMAKPLEELTPEDLGRYSMKALTTWGEVDDLKHFLPRLFELAAARDSGDLQIEVLFGKLRIGLWQAWPEPERVAVRTYFRAVWVECLASAPSSLLGEDILCAIGCAGDDLLPLTDIWTDCCSESGYEHLVRFLDENSAALLKRRSLANGFWSDAETQGQQVMDWVADSRTLKRLEANFEVNSDANYADTLAVAIDRLGTLQKWLQAK